MLAIQLALTLSFTLPSPFSDEDALPRYMTEAEAAYVAEHPIVAPDLRGASVPFGPVVCPPEYGPMEGILMAYEGQSGWQAILREMAAHITTAGNANVYVICDTSSEAAFVEVAMANAGADPDRVFTFVRTTDTIWIRDYGPRYIYEGGVRAIVDHTYNRPRPNDNQLPAFWAQARGEERYQIPLVHGGGNFHLSGAGDAYATRLIDNENPGLNESQIVQLWRDYQNLETEITDPLPSSVDSTQHIDMWMQIIADDAVVIADWPLASGSTHDQVCDAQAASMAAAGYTVTRVPNIGNPFQTHYTFTNVVMCNDIVLLPRYNNINATYSQQALAAWQSALPDKQIIQVTCDAIVTAAGVMHCIVMHVPANSGGENPVVWISSPNASDLYEPGEQVMVTWRSDDDKKDIVAVDLLLSTNGGSSFQTVATGLPDTGATVWTVPDVATSQGMLRLVVHDGDGNTGSDDTDELFIINGADPSCTLADLAEPFGVLDLADVQAFLAAFTGGDMLADLAEPFGVLDLADVQAFIASFVAGCP